MPSRIAGKNEEAARPKAKATVAATNPGGLMPKYPARHTAAVAAIRAAISSPLSEILGITIFFNKSCDTAEEITNNKPAAVESAAAKAPAANNAITQLGKGVFFTLPCFLIRLHFNQMQRATCRRGAIALLGHLCP